MEEKYDDSEPGNVIFSCILNMMVKIKDKGSYVNTRLFRNETSAGQFGVTRRFIFNPTRFKLLTPHVT